jgi:hypothetical protein
MKNVANEEFGQRAVFEKGVDEEDCAGDGVGRGVVGNELGRLARWICAVLS